MEVKGTFTQRCKQKSEFNNFTVKKNQMTHQVDIGSFTQQGSTLTVAH